MIALSNIHIRLRWNRIHGNDEIAISINAIFGWVVIEKSISEIDFINLRKGIQVDESRITYHTIKRWAEAFKKLLNQMRNPKEWFSQTIKLFKCEKMRWRTQIGLDDAASTALIVGITYAIKHSLVGISRRMISYEKIVDLLVIPTYNQSVFTTQLDSMFRIRLAHAIYAAFLLVFRISKTRGGIQLWRNIRFKG
ncbi:MAG: hypothetical protein RLZZ267_684 [Bacillota bacterium]